MTPEQMRRAAEIVQWIAVFNPTLKHPSQDEAAALARLLREQADAIDTDLLAERTRLLHAAEERIAELEERIAARDGGPPLEKFLGLSRDELDAADREFVKRPDILPTLCSHHPAGIVRALAQELRALLPPPPEGGK